MVGSIKYRYTNTPHLNLNIKRSSLITPFAANIRKDSS